MTWAQLRFRLRRLRRLLIVVCWFRGHVFCSKPMIVATTTTDRIRTANGEMTAIHHGFHVGDRIVIQYLNCDRCGRRRR